MPFIWSMAISSTLDTIHKSITSNRWLQLFTAMTRCLLAIGFIPPSIPKILHHPFTMLPDTDPVGHYFRALYDTGFYYEFIGWAQITAALLILFPRTAHIGAIIFLPIIANIAVLTCSVGFKGTWLVTILMGLAASWLVVWEYDRLKPILLFDRGERSAPFKMQFLWLPFLFAVGGLGIAVIWWIIGLGNFANYMQVGMGLVILGAVFGIVVAIHYRFMRTGELEQSP